VLREMTDEAMYQLAQCLPSEMRGAYADSDGSELHWLDFMEQ
jgi:hypothetical protein